MKKKVFLMVTINKYDIFRFVLKGKLKKLSTDNKNKKDEDKLSFELEVCWIPSVSSSITKNMTKFKKDDCLKEAVVGIRRKRLHGDAWIYKNVCEEVLALAAPQKKTIDKSH